MKKKQWPCTLTQEYSLYAPALKGLLIESYANRWMRIAPEGYLTIRARYAWDGATCWYDGKVMPIPPPNLFVRFKKRGNAIRVWTRASLAHDIMYQFMYQIAAFTGMPVREVRRIADVMLRDFGREDGAPDAGLVYAGVRVFGGVYHDAKAWKERLFEQVKKRINRRK